jgi:hypothetical protein
MKKISKLFITGTFLFLAFLFCFTTVNAMTASGRQSLIDQIKKQIADLQAQVVQMLALQSVNSNSEAPAGGLGYPNSGTLQVAQLHAFLESKGYSVGADSGTTNYSAETAEAVKRFQQDNGIPGTGYWGVRSAQVAQTQSLVAPQTTTPATTTTTPTTTQTTTPVTNPAVTPNPTTTTTPTTNPVAPTTTTSVSSQLILITLPAGGEAWKVGETHNITWPASAFSSGAKVGIYMNLSYTGTGPRSLQIASANSISASAGSYAWTIPASNLYGISSWAGKNITMYVYTAGSPGVFISSNPFTLVDAPVGTTTPTIPLTTITPTTPTQTTTPVATPTTPVVTNPPTQTPAVTPTTPACTDSDNGKDYFTKGTVAIKPSAVYTQGMSLTDACFDYHRIYEGYCGTDGFAKQMPIYTCAFGCDDGACNKVAKTSNIITPALIAFDNPNSQFLGGSTIEFYAYGQKSDKTDISNAPGFGAKLTVYDSNNTAVLNQSGTLFDSVSSGPSWHFSFKTPATPGVYTTKVSFYCADPSKGYCTTSTQSVEKSFTFTVTKPSIKVDYPKGGENIPIGDNNAISWTSSGLPQYIAGDPSTYTSTSVELRLYGPNASALLNSSGRWGGRSYETGAGEIQDYSTNCVKTVPAGSGYKIVATLKSATAVLATGESGLFTLSTVAPVIDSFTGVPNGRPGTLVLSWTLSGSPATTISVTPGGGSYTSVNGVAGIFNKCGPLDYGDTGVAMPTTTTTYTLTATNSAGTATKTFVFRP